MNRSPRQFLFWITTIVIVIAVGGYIFGSSLAYNKLSLMPSRAVPAVPTGQVENVAFVARGRDYKIYGHYLPGKLDYPALISVHGYGGSRFNKGMIARAEAYRDMGYSVLSIDLADSGGESYEDGRVSMGYKERYDVLGAFDYLLTRGFTADRIGVYGVSMGAATSMMALGLEPRVKALFEDSGYARADSVLSEQALRNGFTPLFVPGGFAWGAITTGDRVWEVTPITLGASFAANKQAIYIVHSTTDKTVLYHHGTDLYEAYKAAGVDVTMWTVSDLEHGLTFENRREEFLKRLDTFFKAHLTFSF